MTDESVDEDYSLSEPLTKEQIQQELNRLQTAATEIRESDKNIRRKIKALHTREKDLEREKKWPDARLKFVCTKERNNYARRALQEHYAAGIRE